ncbi:fumarylacetoacetate hydrolase family protein [Loigolactobacillus binensis]|uniref:Fumarylacetoacetate hydrolase family protein n=1 Tax=Loigolactobacillus binensis TaxID=2559922 RepID=A0ABW3EEP7_9LACO|nr:fumarylacetoacetate hydrolase family protein [Loigolactobacillus binensis]
MKIALRQQQPFLIESSTSGRLILNQATILAALQATPANWQLGKRQSFTAAQLTAPIPDTNQIFAIGMNFRDHSEEIHLALPKVPSVFTKFSSALTAPETTVTMHGPQTDWETELVVVIGKAGRNIPVVAANDYIAGYLIGEDLSDREVQFANTPPQFSLGKSFAGYAPIGPWLTTPDEFSSLKQAVITTEVNGQIMQQAPLSQLIFTTPELISYLSSIVELQPGNLIFTGTPSGTGVGHQPPLYLKPGDHLRASITGLGALNLTMK